MFMSAKFGRDEKRGATEAIHGTFSRNAKKEKELRKDLMGTPVSRGRGGGVLF